MPIGNENGNGNYKHLRIKLSLNTFRVSDTVLTKSIFSDKINSGRGVCKKAKYYNVNYKRDFAVFIIPIGNGNHSHLREYILQQGVFIIPIGNGNAACGMQTTTYLYVFIIPIGNGNQ